MIKTVKHFTLIIAGFLVIAFTSCIKEEEFENTPEGNFEMLWKIIDEKYCFFQDKNVDWNEIHEHYRQRITPDMSQYALFEVLGEMLAELKDGHVNLYAAHDVASYNKWYEDYPENFNDSINKLYIGGTGEYRTASGMKYKIFKENIGYIRYESFSSGIGDGNISEVLSYLALCDGLIIDVRNNGGGNLDYAQKLAARFTNKKILTSYIQHKTGPGHNDFSEYYPVWIEPSDYIRWQKPAIVLTNRHSFSATNDFVNAMRLMPEVTILGDRTGGGSGLPFSASLLNGWVVRFSASPTSDCSKKSIEGGIDPDVRVDMTHEDIVKNRDTILEEAIKLLKQ